MPLHSRSFLVVLGLIFLFSCSSSQSSNDSDSISDSDTDTQETETLVDEDSDKDADPIEDSEETSDADGDQDNDSDTAENAECLDLRYNENTIKTPFPFKDANGKPTFCRPGCDTPTENDPQCVRNIWEWGNWKVYQLYLEAQEKDPNQTKERSCYPWPCKLPDMHPKTKETLDTFVSSCDRLLTVNNFQANVGIVWSHGMSDGVAGMELGRHLGIIIEYDPEKDEYKALGQNRALSFNEGRYIVEVFDRYPGLNPEFYKVFTVSILRTENGYFYEFIRDNYGHKDEFLRPPFAGKNWALLRLTGDKTIYASSKDWEWHELGGINNYAGEGNIVGDHLTFITNNRELYYCDLRKYPRHIDECFKLNRKDESGNEELGHSPRIDLDNEYRVVYNVYGRPTFVEVDLKDLRNPKYAEYKVEKKHQNAADWEIDMLKGNRISYSEMIGTLDWFGCFYRFDKQKTYCQTGNNFSTDPANLMGYNVFWGKWHLWKRIGRPTAIIRDLECYCNETNVCPLEPATEEELNRKPPLAPSASKVRDEILERIEEEKVLPKFDGNEVHFCTITERELGQFGNNGYCPTAAQTNKYLKSQDKSDHQLKELILASKKQWKTEKSFTNLVANHKKIWNKFHSCDIQKDFECEYDEMTSTFDSDSVMFATVIDHGIAKDGIFFRDRFYEANGNFAKVIKELREKFGASLRGNPRIELKAFE